MLKAPKQEINYDVRRVFCQNNQTYHVGLIVIVIMLLARVIFGKNLASLKYINKSQGSIILVLIKKMSTFYDRFDYLEFDENPGSEN